MNSVALNINILILTDNLMIIKLNQDLEVYFYSVDIPASEKHYVTPCYRGKSR